MPRRGQPQSNFIARFKGKVTTTTPSGEHKRVSDGRVVSRQRQGNGNRREQRQQRQPPQHQVNQQQAYGGGMQMQMPPQMGGRPGLNDLHQAALQPGHMMFDYNNGGGNAPMQNAYGGPQMVHQGGGGESIPYNSGPSNSQFDYSGGKGGSLPREGRRGNGKSPRAGRPMASAGARRPRGMGHPPQRQQPQRRPETYNGYQRRENRNEELAQNSPNGGLYFSRQSRSVNYRPKTLSEYKRIHSQEYVELGKLPADLNSEHLIKKRANKQRVKDFSLNLRAINQKMITASKRKSKKGNEKKLSVREKARMYAQNIPKPQGFKQNSGISRLGRKENINEYGNDSYGNGGGVYGDGDDFMDEPDQETWERRHGEMSQLDQLEMEHQSSRYNVDAIRREYGF